MIFVIEPVCRGREHAPFNAALIESLVEVSGRGRLTFFAEQAHVDAIREVLGAEVAPHIDFCAIELPLRHDGSVLQRYLSQFRVFLTFCRAAADRKAELCVVSCVTEEGFWSVKLLSALMLNRIKTLVVFHSIFLRYVGSRRKALFFRVLLVPWVVPIVLGGHIVRNAMKVSGRLGSSLRAITHPYLFPPAKSHVMPLRPCFGFVGYASQAKGFMEFLAVVSSVHVAMQNVVVKPFFAVIGRIEPACENAFREVQARIPELVPVVSAGQRLSLDEFSLRIEQCSYLIMPYEAKFYDFIASGSAMDALRYLRPIVALRSAFFEEMFDVCGDIGYLCDSIDEMIDTVKMLSEGAHGTRWSKQVMNLESARKRYSPSLVSEQLSKIAGPA